MSAESVQIGDGLSHLNDGALQQVLAEPAGLAEQQVGAEACPDSGGVAKVLGQDLVPVCGISKQGLLGVEPDCEHESRGELDRSHGRLLLVL